jgi:hypothetical protein
MAAINVANYHGGCLPDHTHACSIWKGCATIVWEETKNSWLALYYFLGLTPDPTIRKTCACRRRRLVYGAHKSRSQKHMAFLENVRKGQARISGARRLIGYPFQTPAFDSQGGKEPRHNRMPHARVVSRQTRMDGWMFPNRKENARLLFFLVLDTASEWQAKRTRHHWMDSIDVR